VTAGWLPPRAAGLPVLSPPGPGAPAPVITADQPLRGRKVAIVLAAQGPHRRAEPR